MIVKFNNKKQVSPWGLFLSFLFMVSLALLGSYYIFLETRIQPLEVGLWLFFLASVILFYFGGFCYVDVDLSLQKIDVKYYKLFPFGRQYKRILLPLDKIKSIKIGKGIGPIGRRFIINGVVKGKLALYPSVGLAACSAKQVKELEAFITEFNRIK